MRGAGPWTLITPNQFDEINQPQAAAVPGTHDGQPKRIPVVAVVDTGIMIDHPDLKASVWTNPKPGTEDPNAQQQPTYSGDLHGYNFIFRSGEPGPELVSSLDSFGLPDEEHKVFEAHGTHVAGIIAAGNGPFGQLGVARNVKIMALKVLGGPWGEGTNADIIEAINYPLKPGADAEKVKAQFDKLSHISTFRQISRRDDAWRVDFKKSTTVEDAVNILRSLDGVRDAEVSGTVQIQVK
jgi:subtilisin family serine protease